MDCQSRTRVRSGGNFNKLQYRGSRWNLPRKGNKLPEKAEGLDKLTKSRKRSELLGKGLHTGRGVEQVDAQGEKNKRNTGKMTIKTIEQLVTLLFPKTFNDMIREHIDYDFEWDYSAKTFNEMNVDDLDMIEVIMNIEKEYDCEIPDDLGEYMFSMDPQPLMRSYIRNKRIEELGL